MCLGGEGGGRECLCLSNVCVCERERECVFVSE